MCAPTPCEGLRYESMKGFGSHHRLVTNATAGVYKVETCAPEMRANLTLLIQGFAALASNLVG